MTDQDFYGQKSGAFLKAVGKRTFKIMKYAMMLRFLINILVNKLNVRNAVKNFKPVLQLGIGCGTYSALYHMVRRLFAKIRQSNNKSTSSFWLSQGLELFTACSCASFGLSVIAPENDCRLMKFVIFSRAIATWVRYIGDSSGLY